MSTTFAILHFLYGAISKFGLPSRLAVETFTCEAHEIAGQTFTNHTIANIYLNNQRKMSTDALVAGVISFKKRQSEKQIREAINY